MKTEKEYDIMFKKSGATRKIKSTLITYVIPKNLSLPEGECFTREIYLNIKEIKL